ncbi:hypothetical protein M409DRAFT_23885 [Zasmidium cellare ATCC 36951]|uniref:Uncharacterized protein n=1 Tax=Zasmidium cellare ATCC 36951 TaxID=1080233 RepID=A0A6A6CI10_ZASCE|nr:uncharacterized protein M409DRAFT_23885 [Zasmidium cellare ATCC 36951]KAF2165592.1 hypothetical protein M409DRAFT_23885 [Zasmidium cellare ATCC 36951]
MVDQIPESEIWASRSNVLFARSQRVLQSWIPSNQSNNQQDEDDESDFKGTRDAAGVGAVNQDEDSELDGILRRKRTDNDKLLEHLIGKKAAEARRKSQRADAGKSMSLSKHAAPKPITSTSGKVRVASRAQDSEDEEEEMGRAATFTSKQRRDAKTPAYATAGGQADVEVDADAEPPDPREELATVKELVKQDEEQDTKPKRRKVGSYLDEVLAQSGKKGKKKKKKTKGGEGG